MRSRSASISRSKARTGSSGFGSGFEGRFLRRWTWSASALATSSRSRSVRVTLVSWFIALLPFFAQLLRHTGGALSALKAREKAGSNESQFWSGNNLKLEGPARTNVGAHGYGYSRWIPAASPPGPPAGIRDTHRER